MELFKYKLNEKFSSSVALATFLLSRGQVLLVAIMLDRADKEHSQHCRALLTSVSLAKVKVLATWTFFVYKPISWALLQYLFYLENSFCVTGKL